MKYIFKIIVFVIIYLLSTYLLAFTIPVLLKTIIPSFSISQVLLNLFDLVSSVLTGIIIIFPVYYYKKQFLCLSFFLNIKYLLLYILIILITYYLIYNILFPHNFEVNFNFLWVDNDFFKSIFYLFRIVVVNAIVLEILTRGFLIEYLLVNRIKPFLVVLISATLFGFVWIFYNANFIPCFSFGLLSALVYLKERNVLYCIILNLIWSIIGICFFNWNI